jgi:hypothetical protein
VLEMRGVDAGLVVHLSVLNTNRSGVSQRVCTLLRELCHVTYFQSAFVNRPFVIS